MRLMGYADKLSVAPGERIRFMVSAEVPGYEATVVRLIHGDDSAAGPGFKEEVIDTPATGHYGGRVQLVHSGSYVLVPDRPRLRDLRSLTLQAWIYPTTPQRDHAQGVLTKWSVPDGAGYGLVIESNGDLAFWIGDGQDHTDSIRSGHPLRARQWYFVACTYDADTQRVCLYQEPLSSWPLDESRATVERATDAVGTGRHPVPLLMAGAYQAATSSGKMAVAGIYNGKIDSPRIFNRALPSAAIEALKNGAPPQEVGGEALVAAWDFSEGMASAKVTDTGRHALHGETHQMPARAMTGHTWTGSVLNVNDAPDQYGAIHFHEHDLEDAGWDADFELVVPAHLRSGVYAVRLSAGDAGEYIPFYVRPARGTSSAPILFLAPTLTYQAYANEHLVEQYDYGESAGPPALEERDEYLLAHRELGLSVYDKHTDGSGCCYSSRLRPILNMRPDYRAWIARAPRHFAADLYMIDWLEARGFPYDVVTDEDLHQDGRDLLSHYKVVVTGSHPEYWTTPMMAALEQYLAQGGRLMYLGGNGFYWVTSIDPQHPHVVEVRRGINGTRSWTAAPGEGYHSTTGEPGGLWRYRGKTPQALTGVGFTAQGWIGAAGYRRQPGSRDPRAAFIFAGVGPDEVIGDFGLVLNGASGDEVDRLDHALGSPPHTLLLASSNGLGDGYQFVIEDLEATKPKQGGTENPRVRSDMTYFEGPNGGAVFAVGSINWLGSLSHNNYDNNVSRITANVLRRFSS